MTIPQDRNLRWSLDFVADTLVSGRRFRRSGSETSSAKPLHSAAKRMQVSANFFKFSVSDIALLLNGGSTCLSQSSAGHSRCR
jgi:hypothetical protein